MSRKLQWTTRLALAAATLCMPLLAVPASLFNGLDPREHWRGWPQETYPEAWVAHQHTLTLRGPIEDGWHRQGGYLLSRERFADFDLRFEFRTSRGANSGVMVRVAPGPGVEWPWQSGTEFQILDPAAPIEPGAVADRSADLYGLVAATGARPLPAGRWNQGRIVACGRQLEHWLNGRRVLVVDLASADFVQRVAASKFAPFAEFGRAAEGHIALQDHGKPVWFRRLVIDRLNASCQRVQ
jgi:hypothetical protein